MALHHHLMEDLYYPLMAAKTIGTSPGLASRNSLRVLSEADAGARGIFSRYFLLRRHGPVPQTSNFSMSTTCTAR
jgi:hypothetical protein